MDKILLTILSVLQNSIFQAEAGELTVLVTTISIKNKQVTEDLWDSHYLGCIML